MGNTIKRYFEYPLLRSTLKHKREEILERFPNLTNCPHNNFLILDKYLNQSPQTNFSEPVYQIFFNFLECRHKIKEGSLKEYLSANEAELNRAFFNLEEINRFNWHDSVIDDRNYDLLRFIDQRIHPTYLRIIESVLCPILRIAAHFSRIDRNAGIEGLDIYNIVDELKNTNLYEATKPYNHIIRNGITHGSITYLQNEIRYSDKENEEKKDDCEIIRIFDDLVDTCNALVIALIVFLLIHQPDCYKLPRQLLIYELIEETKNPWWEIVGCVPQEISKIKQLNIFARSKTTDFLKNQFFAIQSCLLVGMFAPEYDRYVLSLDLKNRAIGWLIFDGKKLKDIHDKFDSKIEDFIDVIEDLEIFKKQNVFSKSLNRLATLLMSFKLHWRILKTEIKQQFGIPSISVRISKIHKNSWGLVLNSKVFIKNPNGGISKDYTRRWCKKIIHKSLRHARRQRSIFNFIRYLPLGYAHISVFKKDHRRRRLADFKLESDLVCTIKIKKLKRIQTGDIYKSEIELFGKYHIAWNRSWLEEISRIP